MNLEQTQLEHHLSLNENHKVSLSVVPGMWWKLNNISYCYHFACCMLSSFICV